VLDEVTTSLGGHYQFEDLLADTYRIRELQPSGVNDGQAKLGNADANGSTFEGTILSSNEMQLAVTDVDATDYDFLELGQSVQAGDTAGGGFWQNKKGQALIAQGGTALAAWLTQNFGNVFGNLFADGNGDDGAEVAVFFKEQLFKQKAQKNSGPPKVDAQFMATALATFFTNSNLAGYVASSYGLNVTDTGIGTRVVNVGSNGAAFGVANGTNLTIMQLLSATNNLTTNHSGGFTNIYDTNGDGVISPAEAALRDMAFAIYSMINSQGSI
jgi:hypothetical protein